MQRPVVSSKLIRYILVGGVAFIIEMAALFGLHKIIGLSPLLSVAISFWVGFIVAFVLQKLITFKNYDRRAHIVGKQLAGYSLLVAFNYLFTLLLVRLLQKHMSVFIIRSLAIIIITSWNFTVYKNLFKLNSNQTKQESLGQKI